jgi:hypothetical protein
VERTGKNAEVGLARGTLSQGRFDWVFLVFNYFIRFWPEEEDGRSRSERPKEGRWWIFEGRRHI